MWCATCGHRLEFHRHASRCLRGDCECQQFVDQDVTTEAFIHNRVQEVTKRLREELADFCHELLVEDSNNARRKKLERSGS